MIISQYKSTRILHVSQMPFSDWICYLLSTERQKVSSLAVCIC